MSALVASLFESRLLSTCHKGTRRSAPTPLQYGHLETFYDTPNAIQCGDTYWLDGDVVSPLREQGA